MTQHPDDRPEEERPDAEADTWWPTDDQDLHPAIDRREASTASNADVQPSAPPLDIDERDAGPSATGTPEIIELAEHVDDDPASPPPNSGVAPGTPELAAERPFEWEDGTPAADAIDASGGPPDDEGGAFDAGDSPDAAAPHRSPGAERDADPTDSQNPPAPEDEPAPSARLITETAAAPSFATRASTGLSGAASRLGLGRLLDTGDDAGDDPAETRAAPKSGVGRLGERLGDSVRAPVAMFTTGPHRRVVAVGLALILIALLANSGGLALIVLSAMLPVMIVITLTQHDVFERESNLLVAAVGAVGAVVGVVLSLLSTWLQSSQWFDTGVLNFGAAGFGGRFADAAGAAPLVVWSLVGLVIPALAIAGIAAGPIGLRRWPQFRNEVMDGVILTGASAAGFAIGASVVYWWPMIADSGPQTNVSDWTLSIIGVALLRTAVITLCGAMIGAGVWRYMVTPAASVILLPAAGGALGYLLLTFGSIQLQAAGNWPEFLWVALLLAAVYLLFRRVLDGAIATDRQALGDDAGRLVCPSCHKVTPAGAFCARCGKPLPHATPQSPASGEAPVDDQPANDATAPIRS